jgi:hypothetical protein
MSFTDFITQKVYFSQLMRVYVGLIMLSAYLCHSHLSQVDFNCALVKVIGLLLVLHLE